MKSTFHLEDISYYQVIKDWVQKAIINGSMELPEERIFFRNEKKGGVLGQNHI